MYVANEFTTADDAIFTHGVVVTTRVDGKSEFLDLVETDARTAWYTARRFQRQYKRDGIKVEIAYGPLGDRPAPNCFRTHRVTRVLFT